MYRTPFMILLIFFFSNLRLQICRYMLMLFFILIWYHISSRLHHVRLPWVYTWQIRHGECKKGCFYPFYLLTYIQIRTELWIPILNGKAMGFVKLWGILLSFSFVCKLFFSCYSYMSKWIEWLKRKCDHHFNFHICIFKLVLKRCKFIAWWHGSTKGIGGG